MYYEFFGLSQAPFKITPDTRHFYEGGKRGDILEALAYAILSGEGIVKVVGEVGSGKTMLSRMLEVRLPEHVDIVYFANPSLSPRDVLYAIAVELKVELPQGVDRIQAMHMLHETLLERHAAGRQVVCFVEEAQAMPLETLEEIRLLSNLETHVAKLLQIVLFGQPELDANLDEPSIRQLRERIVHSFYLDPLAPLDLSSYVTFRMRSVGYRGPDVFTKGAYKALGKASEGLIRRVNIIGDKALLAAYADNSHTVTEKHIRVAVRDSEFGRTGSAAARSPWKVAAGVAALGCTLALGWGLGSGYLDRLADGARPGQPVPIQPANTVMATEVEAGASSKRAAASAEAAAAATTSSAAELNRSVSPTSVVRDQDQPKAVVAAESADVDSDASLNSAVSRSAGQLESTGARTETPSSAAGGVTGDTPDAAADVTVAATASVAPDKPAEAISERAELAAATAAALAAQITAATVAAPAADATAPVLEAAPAGSSPQPKAPVLAAPDLASATQGFTLAGSAGALSAPEPVQLDAPELAGIGAGTVSDDPVPDGATLLQERLSATENWLTGVDQEYFSIQLMLANHAKRRNLERWLERWHADGLAEDLYVYRTRIRGAIWFGVLYNQYPSIQAARSALASLPNELKRHKPFVRNIKDIGVLTVSAPPEASPANAAWQRDATDWPLELSSGQLSLLIGSDPLPGADLSIYTRPQSVSPGRPEIPAKAG